LKRANFCANAAKKRSFHLYLIGYCVLDVALATATVVPGGGVLQAVAVFAATGQADPMGFLIQFHNRPVLSKG
jgi:hypothetical protein